jgi:hypothetical protein
MDLELYNASSNPNHDLLSQLSVDLGPFQTQAGPVIEFDGKLG